MEREVALVRVDVYSAHDAFIGTIPTEELLGFSHSDTLNGEDSVSITTLFHLKAGYRLVWKDEDGIAHEHICQDPKGYHNNGVTLYTDTALNSICETFYDYIEDKRPYSYTFSQALQVALDPTRWSVGTVDQSGTVSSGLTFYHTSAREALQAILECGGELETVITVGGQGVTKRAVSILAHRGESSTHKRFSYGKDITSVSKTEHWGAITACYGYGKGVETDSGGYGRKLTFGDINNNKNYVEDADALKTYGRPNGSGFAHKFGTYENSDCEDASQLLAETKAYLEEHKVPGVTYEADVVDLVQFDRKWEGCGVGDDVQLVDTEFEPELRLTGRVSKLVVDYIGATRSVTLGNVTETMASIYQQQQAEIANISRRSSNWDATTSASPSWLNTLMGNLNEQFNTSGNSYCFTSFEQGTIWSSVPLDENGKPTKTGGSAIQLCSQGLRIASGTKSDGTFDWRSFGTGKGFTADEINAGTMTADRVRAGLLTDEAGKNYWNMDTGEFSLSASAGLGKSTAGNVVVSTDVQYGFSSSASTEPTSWSTTALWEQGKHMWTRTKMTLADGSTEYSAARRIANANGIGAASVQEQYYLSTSSSTQSGGSWTNAQPSWIKGRYYWTRSKITWSDGTITYTTPALARALTSGNQATDDLDDSLTQTDIFNRLTNNGTAQGIYMSNGQLYINGEYIKAGTVETDTLHSSKNAYAKFSFNQNLGTTNFDIYDNKLINMFGVQCDGDTTNPIVNLKCNGKAFLAVTGTGVTIQSGTNAGIYISSTGIYANRNGTSVKLV